MDIENQIVTLQLNNRLLKLNWVQNTSSSIPKKYHIIFWVGYFMFNVIKWGSYFEDYGYAFRSNLVVFPLNIVIAYFNIYYLLPKYVLKQRYKMYLAMFLLALSILYIVRTELIYFLVSENVWPERGVGVQNGYTFDHIVEVSLGLLYVTGLVTAIKLTFDWTYELQRVKQLQKTQLRTELNFLKSQIQPHFFFNTLNNLYALSLEKSDVAPSVILKLSDIMQYVLYDVQEPKVRLFNEIKYINNYIDLERLRFGNDIDVTMDIDGEIEDVELPPLLFLPFIENCFKHGEKNNNIVKIRIRFKIIRDFLEFSVMNYFLNTEESDSRNGIGNKNVRRRLELLYNAKFELATEIDGNTYNVFLKIPINDKEVHNN